MLELRSVRKSYQGRVVIQKESLLLDNGIYWVRGANGSGKTTFLKMVAAMLPFDGDITCNGTSQKKDPTGYRRLVGWAEAEPSYPDFITGMDLVRLYQQVRAEQPAETNELLERFGMSSFIDDRIGTYSAGMTKRLSLVLAFIGAPSVCVLDEPLITLDEVSERALCGLIAERSRQAGTTFLMSSHQAIDPRLAVPGTELIVMDQTIRFPHEHA
ncbi:MAG: transporter [Flaviaesturariibacter sp.]|nr:transporter [Flaviaesturariibacter sp.]